MVAHYGVRSSRKREFVTRVIPVGLSLAAVYPLVSCTTASLLQPSAQPPTFDFIPAGVKAEIKAAELKGDVEVRGSRSMADRVLKARQLKFFSKSELVLESLDVDWLVIFANVLN